jgi:hypothetical protein
VHLCALAPLRRKKYPIKPTNKNLIQTPEKYKIAEKKNFVHLCALAPLWRKKTKKAPTFSSRGLKVFQKSN